MKKDQRAGTVRERFMEKVGENWQWIGGKNKDGYGQMKVDGMQVGAHVISYELFNGEIPAGSFVLHSCDDPGCVNPKHLHLGNHIKNMQERKERGGYASMFGASNPKATISDAQVAEIRKLYATGKYSQQALGKMFGIHQTQVSRLVRHEVRN